MSPLEQQPPQWAEVMMRQMAESQRQAAEAQRQMAESQQIQREAMQQHAAAQDERIRRLEDALEKRLINSPAAVSSTEAPTEPTRSTAESTPVVATPRPRPRLPDPTLFAGSVNDWSTWRITMENKLAVDGEAIGSRQDQFMYVFSRLEKLAWKNTGTFVKHRRNDGGPEDILEYLEKIYGDPNAQARAARKLHQIKQSDGLSFPRFLPRLEKEFADAGAINWPDQARRQILLGSLNRAMSVALMNRGIPDTYSGLITRLHEISTDIDTLNLSGEGSSKTSSRRPKQLDEMDWTPTVNAYRIDTGDRKKAKWVSTEDMKRRCEEDRCLRCGKEGHRIAKCSYLPAERPGSSRVAIGQTKRDRHGNDSSAKRSRVKKAQPVRDKEEEDPTEDDAYSTTDSESENE